MSQSEQLVPLLPAEISQLKSKSRPALGFSIITVIMLALFSYFVLSAWLAGSFIIGKGIVDLTMLVIVVIVGALIVMFKLKSRGPLKADIREGQKKVIIAPMESQRERSSERRFQPRGLLGMFFTNYGIDYKYFVKVKSKEYPVSMEAYYQLKPGSLVEIHEGPHSGQPLSVSPAKS
jgi:hypothetical protein